VITQWFWIDLFPGMAEGRWTLGLFVDGKLVKVDNFELFDSRSNQSACSFNLLL
jgi:hypothetical protein